MAKRIQVSWNEDAGATVLARVTARNGSGAATGRAGEGNWVQQADVSTITCNVYEEYRGAVELVDTPTVTVSSAILDTPVTTNVLWTLDTTGYNFLHDLDGTNFRTGKAKYIVEYTFTPSSGSPWHLSCEGCADSILSS